MRVPSVTIKNKQLYTGEIYRRKIEMAFAGLLGLERLSGFLFKKLDNEILNKVMLYLLLKVKV
jgi:hypothetical protein